MFKKKFEPLLFFVIALKINNKIYSETQVQELCSLKYKENKILLHQFSITLLKKYEKIVSK